MHSNEQVHINTSTEVFLSDSEGLDKAVGEVVDIYDFAQLHNRRKEFKKDDIHKILVPTAHLPPPCKLFSHYRKLQKSGGVEGVTDLTLDFDNSAYKRKYCKKIGEMVAKHESASWSSTEDNRQFLSYISDLPLT